MVFSEKLRHLRKEKNLSQQAVAQQLHISLRAYQNYEVGVFPRDPAVYQRIATFYGVSLDSLMRDDLALQPVQPAEPPPIVPESIRLRKMVRAIGKAMDDDKLNKAERKEILLRMRNILEREDFMTYMKGRA